MKSLVESLRASKRFDGDDCVKYGEHFLNFIGNSWWAGARGTTFDHIRDEISDFLLISGSFSLNMNRDSSETTLKHRNFVTFLGIYLIQLNIRLHFFLRLSISCDYRRSDEKKSFIKIKKTFYFSFQFKQISYSKRNPQQFFSFFIPQVFELRLAL